MKNFLPFTFVIIFRPLTKAPSGKDVSSFGVFAKNAWWTEKKKNKDTDWKTEDLRKGG